VISTPSIAKDLNSASTAAEPFFLQDRYWQTNTECSASALGCGALLLLGEKSRSL